MTTTLAQAETVLAQVREQFAGYIDAGYGGPTLIMAWDWLGHGASPAIVWEEGPDDWALTATGGGSIDDIVRVAGIFLEPITTWALGIYPDWN